MTHAAIDFLRALDGRPEARFNIECYTDVPKSALKPKPDPLLFRRAGLTLSEVDQLLQTMQFLNARGAGIFVTRNECDGHRSAASVSHIRGIHADMDNVTKAQLDHLFQHLPPSIVVQTSAQTRVQVYWQLAHREELTPDEAKALNQALVQYGADPAAVDASRLLRLPGFRHMKYRLDGQTPLVTATYFDNTYTANQLRAAFPCKPAAGRLVLGHHSTLQHPEPEALNPELTAIAAAVRQKHQALWDGELDTVLRPNGKVGYDSQSEADLALAGAIARTCVRGGVPETNLFGATEAIFNRSKLASRDKWQSRPDYRERTIAKALSDLQPPECTVVSPPLLDRTDPIDELTLESHGDIRNAKALAHLARNNYVHITTRERWMRWSEEKWVPCEKDEHVAMAKEACRRILATATSVFADDQERGKRLISEAMAAHNLAKIQAMLKLAVSEPGMSVTDRELDANPLLLGVANGVVDLRSGLLLANEPSMLITRYCAADFVEGASCPRWLAFLDQVFLGDRATIAAAQRLLGYTLTGLNTEEVLVISYGHGSNGKSVFSNTVLRIMGGYGMTAPSSLLTARRADDSGPRNDLAALAGARLVSINELQAGDRLDEQVVKMLAGREPIAARFLFREFFEYVPQFTPWMRTNHKPIVTGEDDGIWRRLVLLPFLRNFKDGEKDPNLEQKLLAERDGILQWMLEGARLYLKDGLQLSPLMQREVAAYRKDSDVVGEFLAEKATIDANSKALQADVYRSYKYWCEENGLRLPSKKSFTQRLAERGFTEAKSGADRYYTGLTIHSLFRTVMSPEPQVGVDGMDRISAIFHNFSQGDSYEELTPNSQ